ncbi:hypothetical protein W03_16200 [Nitrosomonas sp. PY1]|uniref:hypothetical protein n=1 Tax=Nitrosomonas sp. PY1 TaxID=1803906 RepID=UPI001FC8819A|nr:hypothetical protein [Nitrosomonas sp. PY1]GKS69616.1 hypothetical protein W03_16200 [Nitrosomonas sp. PY1]
MNQEYFKQAELALAAYASLNTGAPDRAALVFASFSEVQAITFATTYRVVTQYNDPATGLSATVFADKNTE